ncbi:hypothetical protein [Paracoccus yeei]|nr:hypothetical protein [Paracoccus yeei]
MTISKELLDELLKGVERPPCRRRKGKGGRLLRRRQQLHAAASVA